jgi:hypothetical protein
MNRLPTEKTHTMCGVAAQPLLSHCRKLSLFFLERFYERPPARHKPVPLQSCPQRSHVALDNPKGLQLCGVVRVHSPQQAAGRVVPIPLLLN